MKTLVAYFSAEGTTAAIAEQLAEAIDADIFEIRPQQLYSKADINWRNPLSRCNKEKIGKKDVPIEGKIDHFDDYECVLIGFPIWYGAAPNVVNTFCKDYKWDGKKVVAFATSGGSGIGKTQEKLQPYVQGGDVVDAICTNDAGELIDWAKNL